MNKLWLNTSIAQHIRDTRHCSSVDGVPQERSTEDSWRRVLNQSGDYETFELPGKQGREED